MKLLDYRKKPVKMRHTCKEPVNKKVRLNQIGAVLYRFYRFYKYILYINTHRVYGMACIGFLELNRFLTCKPVKPVKRIDNQIIKTLQVLIKPVNRNKPVNKL